MQKKAIQWLFKWENIESAIFSGFSTTKFQTSFQYIRTRVCLHPSKVMASTYFNTDQVLKMVLGDGSDLEDEDSSAEDFNDQESERDLENCSVLSKDLSFSEGSVQRLLPCERSSLLAEEVRAKNSVFIVFHFLDQV